MTTTVDSGAGSLRQAIADAMAGDTITFAAGMTTVTLTSGQLTLAKNVTIAGGAGVTVQRDASAAVFRVFAVNSGVSATLTALTIMGGYAGGGDGGGILSQGNLTLTDVAVMGNRASNYGGGIRNDGTLTLAHVAVSGNSVTTFGDGSGGGLYNNGGAVSLTGSTVSGNGTSSGNGGGLYNNGGTMTLTNSTVADNTAINSCGIITRATLTLASSTVSGNNGCVFGGGISRFNSGTVSFTGSIIAGNSSGDLFSYQNGPVTDGGNNILGGDPLLASLGNYGGPTQTRPPLPGSPAIDAGGTTTCPATDQRGVPRPQGLRCDIGAVEVAPPNAVPTLTGLATDAVPVITGAGGTVTLTVDGTGFAPGFSTVRIDGLATINGGAIATTYVSPTRLAATLPAFPRGAAGQYTVTVLTTPPGGGSSNPLTLTVTNLVPALTGLEPTRLHGSTPVGSMVFPASFPVVVPERQDAVPTAVRRPPQQRLHIAPERWPEIAARPVREPARARRRLWGESRDDPRDSPAGCSPTWCSRRRLTRLARDG